MDEGISVLNQRFLLLPGQTGFIVGGTGLKDI